MLSATHRQGFVFYIVTQADTKARSHIFYYDKEYSSHANLLWAASDGRVLKIDELVAARLSAG